MRVEFLETIQSKDFAFKEGKSYQALDGKTISHLGENGNVIYDENLRDMILVCQPNSPATKDWYCQISKKDADTLFRILPEIREDSGKKSYTKDFYLTKSQESLCKDILTLTCDGIQEKYGFKKNENITFDIIFTDNIKMRIKLIICNKDSRSCVQAVLFDSNQEVARSKDMHEFQDSYALEYKGSTYHADAFVL